MTLAVAFRRAARLEFDEAAAHYEAQRVGLATEFIAEIDRCLTLAAEQPQQFSFAYHEIRRVTARRFPYSVYFVVETRRIVVLSVFTVVGIPSPGSHGPDRHGHSSVARLLFVKLDE